MELLRHLSGFPLAPGSYHLPRAAHDPPFVLQKCVWPWLESWEERFHSRNRRKNFQEGGLDQDDLAGQGFIKLLRHLRTVLLQDLAVLQPSELDHHPDS